MRIKKRKISDLKLYENNPVKHPPKQINVLRKSIREYGFNNPVLIDSKDNVIAGHGRIEAAKLEGMKELPCINLEHLSDEQAKQYRLIDNKLAELSVWDDKRLEQELKKIDVELKAFGFEKIDLPVEGESQEQEPEVEFTNEVLEEHNYVVFTFNDSLDWMKVKQFFDIKKVQALDSKGTYIREGIGRVLNGDKLSELIDEVQNV